MEEAFNGRGQKTKSSPSQVTFIDEKARSDHEDAWGGIADNMIDIMR